MFPENFPTFSVEDLENKPQQRILAFHSGQYERLLSQRRAVGTEKVTFRFRAFRVWSHCHNMMRFIL